MSVDDPSAVETQPEVPTGETLVHCRQRLGLSRTDLADRLDVHPSTPYYWEIGRHEPSNQYHHELRALARRAARGDELASETVELWTCQDCSRTFETLGGLSSHQTQQHGPCATCQAYDDESLRYAVHRTEHHGVPHRRIDHLEPGAFRDLIESAETIPEIADTLGWQWDHVIQALNAYEDVCERYESEVEAESA